MPKSWKEQPPSAEDAEPAQEKNISPQEAAMFAAEIGEAPQIDLHGESADAALSQLDAFIHHELMRGSEAVKIIHGRGTGTLRAAILAWLQRHPTLIAAHRDASSPAQQGGMTVVALHRL